MSESESYRNLLGLLKELGVRTAEDRAPDGSAGFPLILRLQDGGSLVLDLPNPAFIDALDPDGIGVAILDPLGYPRTTWGLARRIPYFRATSSVLESPIGSLLEGSYQGTPGALYYDGYRYFTSGLSAREGNDVFVLVVNAQEERQVRRQASKSWRMASALKRLGKALTMNQTMHPLCVAAAHEIASATELAAVLLWTHDSEAGVLELVASVGANRLGAAALNRLSGNGGAGCAAELVATTRQPFFQSNVLDHVLTANLEAKFCYLKPSGVSVHPLEISGKLLGVLELVGREGDAYFADNAELFQTIAEHIALAINSAAMFENFERLASHDALTGLPNHRSMQEFLHQRLSESERTGQALGAIMIDVDHFRSFNEEEGHDAGDEVLRMVGDALKQCLRPYDLAARYGGEEFTVLMPNATQESIMSLAERMRHKVESMPFVTKSGRVTQVTVSLGCAIYPTCASDAPSLLKSADVALYEAKRAGRNRAVFFEGKQDSAPRPPSVSLDDLKKWVHPLDWEEGEGRADRLEAELNLMCAALRLSQSQQTILNALLRVAPTYVRAVRDEDSEFIASMHAAPEFRVLIPSLERINMRFDCSYGSGVRLPLLARVLQVILAVDNNEDLYADPGRFDPEIVALVTDLHRAA